MSNILDTKYIFEARVYDEFASISEIEVGDTIRYLDNSGDLKEGVVTNFYVGVVSDDVTFYIGDVSVSPERVKSVRSDGIWKGVV